MKPGNSAVVLAALRYIRHSHTLIYVYIRSKIYFRAYTYAFTYIFYILYKFFFGGNYSILCSCHCAYVLAAQQILKHTLFNMHMLACILQIMKLHEAQSADRHISRSLCVYVGVSRRNVLLNF